MSKIRLLLFSIGILIFSNFSTTAQLGKPYQQYYSPKEYKAHQLVWWITQDARGVVYAANNDGVLSYDGQHWELISTPNPVRSLSIDKNNRIFVGCKGDFGMLKIDSTGSLLYQSIRKLLPKQDQVLVKDFDKVYCTDGAIWFISEFMLVKATESGGLFNLTTWKFEQDGLTGAGLMDGKLYIHQRGVGLCEATSNGLKPAHGGDFFKDKEITAIKTVGNEKIIATATAGLFKFTANQVTAITTPIDNHLKSAIIYEVAPMQGNQFAVATMLGGVYVVSLSGQVLQTFTKETGFPDNDIYYVYTDKQGGLWIAYSKGLARIGLNIPITQLTGIEGKVASMVSFNNLIYAATSQGIFEQNGGIFRRISGINTECRSLRIFNGKLYAASNKGLIEINNGAIRFVLPNELCLSIGTSTQNGMLLASHFKGIWVIDPSTGIKTDIPKVTEESFSFCETPAGDIWVGTSYQGAILLKPNGKNFSAQKFGQNDGLPEGKVEIKLINKEAIFKTENGFYEYNGGKFAPLNTLNKIAFSKVADLVQGSNTDVWTVQESGVFSIDGNLKADPKINPISPANILQEKPTVFYIDDKNIQWIAINDQIFRLDNSRINVSNAVLLPVITRVTTASGIAIFNGYYKTEDEKASYTQSPKFIPELLFSQNSLMFEYGIPSFENEKGTQFQLFLEGNDNGWSAWSKDSKITYTNLSSGDYLLRIRSKNAYGAISQEITYSFKISPPWYLTWWAYICYFLLLSLIVYIVVRVNSQRLVSANLKLEQTVNERTREIAKQKEEIEKQKVEVEKSRDLLEEKNQTIQEAYTQLQNTQAQLIQSEKMASLGQLIAGVAHEINTPIGAINASAGNIDKSLPVILQKLPFLVRSMDSSKEQLFFQLIERTMGFSGSLTSREERQYKKSVTEYLENNQVENAANLAAQLAKIGLIDNLDPFLILLKDPNSTELIDTATVIGKLRLNLDNIKLAIAKTQKIVFALKSYSHRQSDDVFVQANIIENMETVLTIYHNQLKYGIEVHTDFDESTPLIWCLPDELNQVWTNIIHNAIQAMDNKGTLDISIQRFGNKIITKLTDSGPGIPQDIAAKIFEPFFTTKKQGEGSGLGLDICRKIILKHQGNISVESQPGKTTFIVELPILETPPQKIA